MRKGEMRVIAPECDRPPGVLGVFLTNVVTWTLWSEQQCEIADCTVQYITIGSEFHEHRMNEKCELFHDHTNMYDLLRNIPYLGVIWRSSIFTYMDLRGNQF
jgi:hypothetical protein